MLQVCDVLLQQLASLPFVFSPNSVRNMVKLRGPGVSSSMFFNCFGSGSLPETTVQTTPRLKKDSGPHGGGWGWKGMGGRPWVVDHPLWLEGHVSPGCTRKEAGRGPSTATVLKTHSGATCSWRTSPLQWHLTVRRMYAIGVLGTAATGRPIRAQRHRLTWCWPIPVQRHTTI